MSDENIQKVKLIHSDGLVLLEDGQFRMYPMDHGGSFYERDGKKKYFTVGDEVPVDL